MSLFNMSPRYTHGPIVRTGPTAGLNRSRNMNGQWHVNGKDVKIMKKV